MFNKKKDIPKLNGLDILLKESPFNMNAEQRASMTISCTDSNYIPKVPKAGQIIVKNGKKYQIMFNGMLVKLGGYHGKWMQDIIIALKGHHEPQEEKIFYEILQKLDEGSSMIELGSFWSYYSIWFNMNIKNAINIACEPDPNNMEIGKINANINNANIKYYNTAAGFDDDLEIEFTLDSDLSKKIVAKIKSVDKIVEENNLSKLDILHMDIQGVELDALKGALKTIKQGNLRYLIVSTHHYFFSGDPLTHAKCIDFIIENGGHIIADHSVLESFSGDGLIAASFNDEDKNFKIDISINKSSNSLFRPYEKDIAILLDGINNEK